MRAVRHRLQHVAVGDEAAVAAAAVAAAIAQVFIVRQPCPEGLPAAQRVGRSSGFRSCLHYYWEKDAPSWFFCSDPAKTPANSEVRYGEIGASNLAHHVVRRLTYNPDFDGLAADLVEFLDGGR
jgi:hypothetical protein